MDISDYNEVDIPKDMAQRCYQAMDACNLSGVVHSLADEMKKIWEIARKLGKGTEWVNGHPIVTMYLDKLTELNHADPLFEVQDAYALIKKIIDKP